MIFFQAQREQIQTFSKYLIVPQTKMASPRNYSDRMLVNPARFWILARLDRRLVYPYFRLFLYRCAFSIGAAIWVTKKYFNIHSVWRGQRFRAVQSKSAKDIIRYSSFFYSSPAQRSPDPKVLIKPRAWRPLAYPARTLFMNMEYTRV